MEIIILIIVSILVIPRIYGHFAYNNGLEKIIDMIFIDELVNQNNIYALTEIAFQYTATISIEAEHHGYKNMFEKEFLSKIFKVLKKYSKNEIGKNEFFEIYKNRKYIYSAFEDDNNFKEFESVFENDNMWVVKTLSNYAINKKDFLIVNSYSEIQKYEAKDAQLGLWQNEMLTAEALAGLVMFQNMNIRQQMHQSKSI